MYKKIPNRLYATTIQKKAIFRNWRKLGYPSVRSFVLELFHRLCAPCFGVCATFICIIYIENIWCGCMRQCRKITALFLTNTWFSLLALYMLCVIAGKSRIFCCKHFDLRVKQFHWQLWASNGSAVNNRMPTTAQDEEKATKEREKWINNITYATLRNEHIRYIFSVYSIRIIFIIRISESTMERIAQIHSRKSVRFPSVHAWLSAQYLIVCERWTVWNWWYFSNFCCSLLLHFNKRHNFGLNHSTV